VLLDEVKLVGLDPDRSISRDEGGEWVVDWLPTIGGQNRPIAPEVTSR
jgi:hypothetical protein